ncbi:hypothetical protein LTR28_006028 [Elasticomyces elasticus]|nr:hypothetical protein LTR28_006028 [Elasticomyces elasticus]
MACLFKKVRGYLFAMQLLQLPLVTLSRTKLLKGKNLLGNVVFWIGLFVGPSILTSQRRKVGGGGAATSYASQLPLDCGRPRGRRRPQTFRLRPDVTATSTLRWTRKHTG